ncbi:MAG TPA: hypothetical protein VK658_27095 [Chryseolinea sp.]|nr:hypothetical protein [Chryseolinea sp.]
MKSSIELFNTGKDLVAQGASFWISVLTDLRSRAVEDILIISTENLKALQR